MKRRWLLYPRSGCGGGGIYLGGAEALSLGLRVISRSNQNSLCPSRPAPQRRPLCRELGKGQDRLVGARPGHNNLRVEGLAERATVVAVADPEPETASRADLVVLTGTDRHRKERFCAWTTGKVDGSSLGGQH